MADEFSLVENGGARHSESRRPLLMWLADLFWNTPDLALLQAFPADSVAGCRSRAGEAAQDLAAAVDACIAQGEGALRDARIEYTSLFCSTERDAPFPYESVYATEERLLMRPSLDEVVRAYGRAGFDPLAFGACEPEDHLSTQLRFIAFLDDAGGASPLSAGEAAALRQPFVRNHLLNWIPRFAAEVSSRSPHSLYAAAANLTAALLEEEVVGEQIS